MAKFCSECGSPLEMNTGLCPKCNGTSTENINQMPANEWEMPAVNQVPQQQTPTVNQVPQQQAPAVNQLPQQQAPAVNQAPQQQAPTVNQVPQQQTVYPQEPIIAETPVAEAVGAEAMPVENPPKKKKNKVLTTIITVILSIFLFSTVFLSTVIFDVRRAVKEESVNEVLDDVDIFDTFEFFDVDIDDDLGEFIDFMDSIGYEIDEDTIETIVDESTGKAFAAKKTGEFFEDFYAGKNAKLEVTYDEIIALIDENIVLFENELGDIPEYKKEQIASWITYGEDERQFISSNGLEDKAPAVYGVAYYGMSYLTLTILIILALLIIFFMFFNSLSQGLNGAGIVFGICGLGIVVIWLLSVCVPRLLGKILGNAFLGKAVGEAVSIVGVLGVIYLVISVALFVIRKLIPKK